MAMLRPATNSLESDGAASTGGGRDVSNVPGGDGVLAKRYISFDIVAAIMKLFSTYYSMAKSFVYDTVILHMTERWYRTVLERLDDGSILLDVGIGTGGASARVWVWYPAVLEIRTNAFDTCFLPAVHCTHT